MLMVLQTWNFKTFFALIFFIRPKMWLKCNTLIYFVENTIKKFLKLLSFQKENCRIFSLIQMEKSFFHVKHIPQYLWSQRILLTAVQYLSIIYPAHGGTVSIYYTVHILCKWAGCMGGTHYFGFINEQVRGGGVDHILEIAAKAAHGVAWILTK